MLSSDTRKINITLTFPATRTSNLTVKNNFHISTCTLNILNYKSKFKDMTSPHSCQSVAFSPTQHSHTHRNLNASFLKARRVEKITAGKLQVWKHIKCVKNMKK